jgi:hypothetical protein
MKEKLLKLLLIIVHFSSMDAYKTNLLPTFVLYRSP